MNKIFRAIWNESTGTWVAVSETARSKTRRAQSLNRLVLACAVFLGALCASPAHADEWTADPATNALNAGLLADASAPDAIAVGTSANASGESAIAVGKEAQASTTNATAIGAGAVASGRNSIAAGAGAFATGGSSLAAGTGSVASGSSSVAAGAGSLAGGDLSVATGAGASASGTASIAAGASALASGGSSFAAGAGALASGDSSSALGAGASAADTNAIALGTNARSRGRGAITFGEFSSADGVGAAAIGQRATAKGANAFALGTGAKASAENSVALGSGSSAAIGARNGYQGYNLSETHTSAGEVNIGNRTISGVAPGLADDEAVNVAQLKGVSTKVDSIATAADGAVKYDRNADGTANHDSITLEGNTSIHNVAAGVAITDAVNVGQLNDAVSQVSNAAVNSGNPLLSVEGDGGTEGASSAGAHAVAVGASASASGAGAVAVGNGAAARGNGSVALGQNAVADRANTVSVGAAGSERQVTNVAAGTQGTDAVNVNQLNASSSGAVRQANSYTDNKVDSVRKDGYGGTAAALAVAGLPQAVLPGRGMVALGGGTYGGQSAVAVGVSQLSENGIWAYKATGTTSTRGEFGVSIGAGLHW